MHSWARRFGFGERTGIEIPGESRGILPPPDKWSQMRVANVAFGQGISVTPVQLISAYCAVANGGHRVHPHVVKAIIHPGGQVETKSLPEPKRIFSPATASRLRDVLERVIVEGTGQRAQIAGHRLAGKTGTAQKPTPDLGFRAGKYIASFVGFAPVHNPRLAALIVIDEPRNGHYGGEVAAPAFKAICERSLTVLRVPPDRRIPGLTLARAAGPP